MQILPGGAIASSLAATLTPSPNKLSPSIITSPVLMPTLNSSCFCLSGLLFKSKISFWIFMTISKEILFQESLV